MALCNFTSTSYNRHALTIASHWVFQIDIVSSILFPALCSVSHTVSFHCLQYFHIISHGHFFVSQWTMSWSLYCQWATMSEGNGHWAAQNNRPLSHILLPLQCFLHRCQISPNSNAFAFHHIRSTSRQRQKNEYHGNVNTIPMNTSLRHCHNTINTT